MTATKKERNLEIIILLSIGLSLTLVAEIYGLSKARVSEIRDEDIKTYKWLMKNRKKMLPEIITLYLNLITRQYE